MANLNGTAASIFSSVGMFGGGVTSAGTGSSDGGFGFEMPDNLQFNYTTDGASPAVFTSAQAVTSQGALVNGTPVSLGFTSPLFAYTCTQASPGVITCQDLTNFLSNTSVLLGQAVQFFGSMQSLGGITASPMPQESMGAFPPQGGGTPTTYYMKSPSGATFRVAASLGGADINTTGTAITAASSQSVLQVASIAPSGFSVGVTYYMVSVSGNTFQLAATVGGSGINGGGTASAGIFQFQTITQTDLQIPYGTAGGQGALQGIVQNGWRVGLQPGQAVASASSLSLDENPQLAWQNVPGSTCQTGNADSIIVGGTNYGTQPDGWGMKGGYSVTGAAGQVVYEEKMPVHLDDNGVPETAAHRKVRLTEELNALKAKGSPTAKETERKAVVESALKELK